VLIRQDDLLERPVESILKQISTLEEEQGVTKKVSAAMEMPVYMSKEHGDLARGHCSENSRAEGRGNVQEGCSCEERR
jgi:hypothetical protein